MDNITKILLTRGVELCGEWDKHNDAMNSAMERWGRHFHDEKRIDAGTRLDEICSLANQFGIASYDDFREQIQKSYENTKEEDA